MPRFFTRLTPEGKGIVAELDDDSVVTFAVEAGPSSSVRGSELFDDMMAHLGSDVRAISGIWRKGIGGHPSTNIDRVNDLTAQGTELMEAVSQTWTVTRARRWGYSRTAVLSVVGDSGNYDSIDVLIEK